MAVEPVPPLPLICLENMALNIRFHPNLDRGSTQSRLLFTVLISALAICSVTRAGAFAPDIARASPQSSISQKIKSRTGQSLPKSIFQTRGGATSSTSRTKRRVGKVVFDNAPLWHSQKILAGVNLLGFWVSSVTPSQLHLDLLGTGAFAAAAMPTLLKDGKTLPRVKLSSLAVTVWSIKLAGFLFYRVGKKGHDLRLDDMLSTVGGTGKPLQTNRYLLSFLCAF